MKKLFSILVAIMAITIHVSAQSWTPVITDVNGSRTNNRVVYQKGYTRNNGTYVKGHYKTRSNSTNWDNFSSKGNSNPFTGSTGSIAKDYTPKVYNYGSGRTIHTGSRGGQYYINNRGNKTYVPKRTRNNLW